MIFNVLETRLIYCNVFIEEFTCITAINMNMLELAVVMTIVVSVNVQIAILEQKYSHSTIAPPCIQNEVRLMRNRVQICKNEVWGYVCNDFSWTDNDTSVVCKELGFFSQGSRVIIFY